MDVQDIGIKYAGVYCSIPNSEFENIKKTMLQIQHQLLQLV